MTNNSESLYQKYTEVFKKIADIKYASAVLQWDQETYLPKKGNDARGRQIATLNETAHDLFIHEKTGAILHELSGKNDLNDVQKRNVKLSLEDYNRNIKFTSAFVRKMSEAINTSFHAWIAARKENDFTIFEKPLAAVIDIKKEEANIIGYSRHPYDALMNDYDKGLTVATTDALFAKLRPALTQILDTIKKQEQVNDNFLHQHFNKDAQWNYGLHLLKKLHFDLDAGRQDISEHPFTTSFNSKDVRLTTRIDENDFSNMTWSCIHECGHGLYEQGLPVEQYGLPLGEFCSLSIHESQSRLWENNVGRSLPFWKKEFPALQKVFPQLNMVEVSNFYKGINKVQPSLIRTEADELTYHFHVMIRYELEKKLIEGSLTAADIRAYWNEQYKNYLGVTVPDDKAGCLQDVHWSHGSFGYFATYSIGSLYAAQLMHTMLKDVPINQNFQSGETNAIFSWLQQQIYPYGRYYNSDALCKQATGEPLNSEYFIQYATAKFSEIYVS